MKFKLLILLLLTYPFAFGQNYYSLIEEADVSYETKEYQKGILLYQKAFKIDPNKAGDLYNASCTAALSGDKKLAFKWLKLAIKKGWENIVNLKSDKDLVSLHDSKEWDKLITDFQKKLDKQAAKYDKPLQAELLAILEDDQSLRNKYSTMKKNPNSQKESIDSLAKIILHKDSINQVKITKILDKYGWVGPKKVGNAANQALFLVIQHADLATQQKYLPMMRDAVKNKNAQGGALALLEDRVALREGKKQIYGTQIGTNLETNKSIVSPLEDPDNVDKRREKIGLPPMAHYVKRWNIVWDVEEYKKTLLENETQKAEEK